MNQAATPRSADPKPIPWLMGLGTLPPAVLLVNSEVRLDPARSLSANLLYRV
jgi:hypothetical protein